MNIEQISYGAAPCINVTNVVANSDYTLTIDFSTGEKKLYNAMPLLDKPIYYCLKNLSFFLSANAECGTVVWNDETDIAPEHLYECSVTLVQ